MKLQSAMEYLMTYGWAILIIAVVMVALFSLGILGGNPLGTSCLASSGYICQTPILHSTTFTAVIGQATGTSWTAANIIFVNQGSTAPSGEAAALCGTTSNTFATSGGFICGTGVTSLTSGGTASVTFTGTSAPTVGTSVAGTIWAAYQIAGSSTWYNVQVATVTLKAV